MLPPRLALAQRPTPLQPLERLSAQLGGPTIWVKRDDLTGSVLSGNKVRKLEFALAQAQADHCDTIITCGGLQSNHCRATALLCAQLGFHCVLILRGETPAPYDGNLLLDWLAGAEIRTYPALRYQRELPALLEQAAVDCRAAGRKPFVIPTGASDGIGLWGYIAACEELRSDFLAQGLTPRHIICATGSGGTQGGLTAGVALYGIDAAVWGIAVCDDESYFQHKVRADLADWQRRYQTTLALDDLNIRVLDQYIGPGYGQAGPEVFATIALVARTEGLVLDPVYTGKAFHALIEELKAGRFGDSNDIVFIHTGGVFGLFPQRDQFDYR
ncbi:MAG: D-cysteine desulfhydrase family protein [Spongiibacteraceae bacterium]